MQAAAGGLGVPVRWGGGWASLLAIASSEDSGADYVAACRATGQKPFLDAPHFELSKGLPVGVTLLLRPFARLFGLLEVG